MITKLNYLCYGVYNKFMQKFHLFEKATSTMGRYGGKLFLYEQECNDKIIDLLQKDAPFMVARYGANELAIMRQAEEKQLGIRKNILPSLLDQFCNNAGFFPMSEEYAMYFFELMKESTVSVDMLGIWYNPMENYFIKAYGKDMLVAPLTGLEPWYHVNPWSKALEGKKVLIIHPFAETIRKQYENRDKIWHDNLLPEMSLYTLKAVQTIAGEKDDRVRDWFQAVEYMFSEAMKIDFEVAILGCGAYGFPLAAKIKQQGKQAIHLGGATQLLFGIKGKRWDDMPEIAKFYNDYWVRPNENETVKNNGSIENGCYW